MSMYYCHRCHQSVDKDYVPCVEDPNGELWLMCEEHQENDSPQSEGGHLKCHLNIASKAQGEEIKRIDDQRVHVIPGDEDWLHQFSMNCPCKPSLKEGPVVVHFGFDVKRRQWIVSRPNVKSK